MNYYMSSSSVRYIFIYFIWKIIAVFICNKYNLSNNISYLLSLAFIDIVVVSWIIYRIVSNNFLNIHVSKTGKESYLSNKNMTLLTENIHHEVKTPLVIIQSKLESLQDIYIKFKSGSDNLNRREIDRHINTCNISQNVSQNESNNFVEDTFSMIFMHISAIYNVLDRMQNFKQIKHSNGNKNLYDVVTSAFITLKLYSKQQFSYVVDPCLKKYHIINLKNEDILNIFINHIKNSLEANSTRLVITANDFKNGRIKMYMSDNGNGIPSSAIPSIFSANFSTKLADGEMRGIGLWLSKMVLTHNGGDVHVEETSSDGTTFCFEIPTEKNEDIIDDKNTNCSV